MTGIKGLGRLVAKEGPSAIPEAHRNLFPLAFAGTHKLSKLPQTFLLHGQNDSAVPVEHSLEAAERLRNIGVHVELEAPDDAEHGFDGKSGTTSVESTEGEKVHGYQSLRKAIAFLQRAA